MKILHILTLALGCVSIALGEIVAPRAWTSSDGKAITAVFLGLEGESVKLKMADGKVVLVPLSRLSEADQAFAKVQASIVLAVPRVWPKEVEVKSNAVEVKLMTEDAAARKFVYRSEGFEYSSQGKLLPSLMKEVARTFEATRELMGKLPWGVVCRPPEGMELYQAALYETREDYIQAGGPTNSGGVYMSGEKIFKIPFESLGIKRLGKSYTKDEKYNSDTLVHEITHQMMHDYLPFIPKWAIEGSAEYTEMLPFHAGSFGVARSKDGLKGYVDVWRSHGRTPMVPSISGIFRLKREEWDAQANSIRRQHDLYQQSALLVYYFNHLDGDKLGTRWIKFMDAAKEEAAKRKAFEAEFKTYRAALEEFFKLPGVKKLEDGRFSYPSGLKPPKAPERDNYSDSTPLKHLNILTGERSDEELQQDIATQFAKIGVKLAN